MESTGQQTTAIGDAQLLREQASGAAPGCDALALVVSPGRQSGLYMHGHDGQSRGACFSENQAPRKPVAHKRVFIGGERFELA